jgi:hypothetical protein
MPCVVGYHSECWHPEGTACCCKELLTQKFEEAKERGGQVKSADSVTDIESTGRKRAAAIAPIEEGMPCEWRNLKFAGGGVVPIMGCMAGIAKDRHHGPNKSTLANHLGNLHRICSHCHNRWHTLNDAYYGDRPVGEEAMNYFPLPEYEYKEHDSVTKASYQELAENEIMWAKRKAGVKS